MPMKENTNILQYVPTIFTGESTEGTNYVHIYYYKCSFLYMRTYMYIHCTCTCICSSDLQGHLEGIEEHISRQRQVLREASAKHQVSSLSGKD